MEKRALLAVVLSIVVLGLWQAFMAPPPPAAPTQPPAQGDSAGEAGAPGPGGAGDEDPFSTIAEPDSRDAELLPTDAVVADAPREFIIETDVYTIRLSNQGGRIVSWRLLEYVDDLGTPHDMVPRNLDPGGEFPFRIAITDDEEVTRSLDEALYLEEVRDAEVTYADGKGLEVTKRMALSRDGYVGHVDAEVRRSGRPAPFRITWAVGLPEPQNGGTRLYWNAEGQGVAHAGGSVRRFDAGDVPSVIQMIASPGAGAIQWGGMESTYFASLLLPEDPGVAKISFAPVAPKPSGIEDEDKQLLAARFEGTGEVRFTSLVGPKDYDLLTGLGRGLDLAVDFSRFSLIYALTKYLFLGLRWINGYVGNYGFSIILMTIIIRTAFFPITYRSSIKMRQYSKKMQKIQPRVKSIQERYRKMKRTMDSQKKMNDEIMGIYKKEGVSPMGGIGGCLPLLLQMPVFFSFYNLLSVTIEMRRAPFIWWVTDLSKMDPYYVFPVLMGASWMVQQAMTSSSIPDPTQRRIMGLMPILFTFMMASMPSGLVIYWFISNLLGLVQQVIINRQADRMPIQASGSS
jgi:YidC/Oxa1 family membrane protein insertase